MAGNSPALGSAVPALFTLPPSGQTLPYLRFEPVPHPVLVLRTEPGPGGSLAQMAIRSRNSNPSLDTIVTAETDHRHVVPPKADVMLVARHGMLDDDRRKGISPGVRLQLARLRARSGAAGRDDKLEAGLVAAAVAKIVLTQIGRATP